MKPSNVRVVINRKPAVETRYRVTVTPRPAMVSRVVLRIVPAGSRS